jgi:hypothetical protein
MRKNINMSKIANISLALFISISHGASAMEGDTPEGDSLGLPRNNYKTILREIEALTARIHREVDQVLADYKRDTEEYHRRMGARGKERNAPPPKTATLPQEELKTEAIGGGGGRHGKKNRIDEESKENGVFAPLKQKGEELLSDSDMTSLGKIDELLISREFRKFEDANSEVASTYRNIINSVESAKISSDVKETLAKELLEKTMRVLVNVESRANFLQYLQNKISDLDRILNEEEKKYKT